MTPYYTDPDNGVTLYHGKEKRCYESYLLQ